MKVIINDKYEYLKSFIEAVPSLFKEQGELVYQARNQLKTYQVDGVDVIVKSFKKPHWFNRVVYTFFRPSKAKRSYEYALRLLDAGVRTPEPIAYMEEKESGFLCHSYFVSIYEKDYTHLRDYMTGEIMDESLLREIARFIADFHNKGFYHLDMSPGNILHKKEGDRHLFSLVDNNRMLFKKNLSKKDRYKSFQRLSYQPEVIAVFATEYASICGLDPEEAVKMIKKYSSEFFHKEIK